jgi:hypothetical protein
LATEPKFNPVVLIQRTRTDLDVAVKTDPIMVKFNMSVTPSAAPVAGCAAAPQSFTVPNGKRVIFQALPGLGWQFIGWFLDDPVTPVSTNATEVIVVTQPAAGAERTIEARFAPA